MGEHLLPQNIKFNSFNSSPNDLTSRSAGINKNQEFEEGIFSKKSKVKCHLHL